MNSGPTVFIVDDDPGVRDRLRRVFESVGLKAETFSSAEEFLQAFDPSCPGCVVADVLVPRMGGLELQQQLAKMGHPIPLIVITGFPDVTTAVRAMKAGAVSVVEKPISEHILLDSVREALLKDTEHRVHGGQVTEIRARIALLTGRERQVLELVVAGQTSKEIAAKLSLSSKTVETHRAQIMNKLKAHSIAELVRLAIQYGPTRANP